MEFMEEETNKVKGLEAAISQLADANTAMVTAIKCFVRDNMSEGGKNVKVTFREPIEVASCDAIVGFTYDYKNDEVTFADEGGNDEIDVCDMTANELHDVCIKLCDVFGDKRKGSAYAFELV